LFGIRYTPDTRPPTRWGRIRKVILVAIAVNVPLLLKGVPAALSGRDLLVGLISAELLGLGLSAAVYRTSLAFVSEQRAAAITWGFPFVGLMVAFFLSPLDHGGTWSFLALAVVFGSLIGIMAWLPLPFPWLSRSQPSH
jgi:xanthine/uracil permease